MSEDKAEEVVEEVVDEEQDELQDDVNLTDAEREAAKLDLEAVDPGEEEDDDEDDDEEDLLLKEAEEPEEEPEAEEPEPVSEVVEAAPEPAPEPQEAPLEADPYEEALTELGDNLKALKAKYREGDLDTDEFLEQRDVIQEKKQEIQWERREQEILYKAEAQAKESAESEKLQEAVTDFYAANPDYAKSKGLQNALDAHWQDVWVDPQWANKSYAAKMAEARERTDADLGRHKEPAPSKPVEDPAARKAAVKGRGKQPTAPTLADVPNADEATAESEGRYADLAKLDGYELEKELAKKMEQYGENYVDDWLMH